MPFWKNNIIILRRIVRETKKMGLNFSKSSERSLSYWSNNILHGLINSSKLALKPEWDWKWCKQFPQNELYLYTFSKIKFLFSISPIKQNDQYVDLYISLCCIHMKTYSSYLRHTHSDLYIMRARGVAGWKKTYFVDSVAACAIFSLSFSVNIFQSQKKKEFSIWNVYSLCGIFRKS